MARDRASARLSKSSLTGSRLGDLARQVGIERLEPHRAGSEGAMAESDGVSRRVRRRDARSRQEASQTGPDAAGAAGALVSVERVERPGRDQVRVPDAATGGRRQTRAAGRVDRRTGRRPPARESRVHGPNNWDWGVAHPLRLEDKSYVVGPSRTARRASRARSSRPRSISGADAVSAEHFDAVVVGSGFGGSVAAFRLARPACGCACSSVARRIRRARFPAARGHGPQPLGSERGPARSLQHLGVPWARRDRRERAGRRLAPLLEHPHPQGRLDVRAGGPHAGRLGALAGHVRGPGASLRASRGDARSRAVPFDRSPYDRTPKDDCPPRRRRELGLEWYLPKLAVTFAPDGGEPVPGEPILGEHENLHGRTRQTCRLCGECNFGCNFGSKYTLDFNYLSFAKLRHGLDIRTRCEAKTLASGPAVGMRSCVDHSQAVEGRSGRRRCPSRP